MDMNDYQQTALKTAVFPRHGLMPIVYPTLGLYGETGEVVEKVKKVLRAGGEFTPEIKLAIAKELGDVLWYTAVLADGVGYTMNDAIRKAVMLDAKLYLEEQSLPAIVAVAIKIPEITGDIASAVSRNTEVNGEFTQWTKEWIAFKLGYLFSHIRNLASLVGFTIEEIAQMNLQKLADRHSRGVLKGEGDNR